jgi:hypothetical protein
MAYTTTTQVSAEIGGVTIDGSSVPTNTTVDLWIADAKEEIDERCGRTFESTAITSAAYEFHDYDGSGIIKLNNYPIISIESLAVEVNGLSGASADWQTLTEGRTSAGHFIFYDTLGVIAFHANALATQPVAGSQNIRVEYTHGASALPLNVARLATLLVAQRYLQSVASKTATQEGGSVSVGTISVSDPTNYANVRLKEYSAEITDLFNKLIGKFKVRNYDYTVFD